ncbi:MAG: HK97 gp10 family phage protein [bacterium]|nr:HK97 gp10 family phage protein [bacterium]
MGEVKFIDNHIKVEAEIERRICNWLEEVSAEYESQAIRNTRVDTGATKRGWGHTVDTTTLEATVGNSEENAIWEELGTGEYALSGKKGRNVWYVPASRLNSREISNFTHKYHFPIVYGKNGAVFFEVHGKKPQRMLYKAHQNTKIKAIKRFAQIMNKG